MPYTDTTTDDTTETNNTQSPGHGFSPKDPLFSNAMLSIYHVDFCKIPGYLMLRPTACADSFADLTPQTAARVGQALSIATRAIETIVNADRVYCLTFAEIDRRLHFHLFPRTQLLLTAYQQATHTQTQPTNAPLLFEWARTAFAGDPRTDTDSPVDINSVCQQFRDFFRTSPWL